MSMWRQFKKASAVALDSTFLHQMALYLFIFAGHAAEFANSSAGSKFVAASGQWLDSPVAVLKAIDGSGTKAAALLALSEPRYSDAARKLSFKVQLPSATIPHCPASLLWVTTTSFSPACSCG